MPTTVVYDDFNGVAVDTNKWNVFTGTGTVSESGGQIHIADTEGWATGIISKNSFPKATTANVRILASMAGSNAGMIGLQLQNVTLDWQNFVSVECWHNLFYVYHSGWMPTAFPTVDNTEYEYNFAITGSDLNIYVTGGVYSNQLIGSLPGIMTASDYYPFLIAAETLDGDSVSADLVIVYDDFDGPTLDTNKWVVFDPGTGITQSSGQVNIQGNGNWNLTGLISKSSFAVATTPSIRILCTPLGINNVVSLQAQNAALTEPTGAPLYVEIVSVYFYSPNILILRSSNATYVTSVPFTFGVEYEINFVLSGHDIDIRFSGGIYTDLSIYTEAGLITHDNVFVSFNSYQSGLSCNQVTYDEIAGPTPPSPSPSGKTSANPTGVNLGLQTVRTAADQVITVVDNIAVTSRGNVVVVA